MCHNQARPEQVIVFRYVFRIPLAQAAVPAAQLQAWTITPVEITPPKERDVKKIIRILIASLLLAGSLSVYSVADGSQPTPCSPNARTCS
jgi:hypothetical protein